MPDIAELPVGHRFTPFLQELPPQRVDAYVQAVDETNPLFLDGELVPPVALAAYALGGILREIDLPPGAVHAAQEVAFTGRVLRGDAVTFSATLVQNSVRGGWRFLVIDFSGSGPNEHQVVQGKSTVLVPEGDREVGRR